MARPDSKWYKLDSAGILYSALQKEEYSAIYRFSARMEREVDPAALQRAIDRCMPRFPSFAVRIRKEMCIRDSYKASWYCPHLFLKYVP